MINNNVLNALLEAFYDILDLDGKRSILMLAHLPGLMDTKLPTNGTTNWEIFEKILEAMRMLLQYSDKILFQIGRKFSIYLDPYGSSFDEFIMKLNTWLDEVDLTIQSQSPQSYIVTCIAKKASYLLTDEWMKFFYEGIFVEGLRKAVGGDITAEMVECTSTMLRFEIKSQPKNLQN
jgi:hypothetical protein